ncbi:MAG TPA: hypothetical protein VGK20_06875 [Candidatus Binatia bacterium]|jgi:hypothetical protein
MKEAIGKVAIAVAVLAGLASCDPRSVFFVESNFTVADSSRLPHWVHLAPPLSRSDVVARLILYTFGKPTMEVRRKDGTVISSESLSIVRRWSTAPDDETKVDPAVNYPAYMVLDVDGVRDTVEFRRMESVVSMVDYSIPEDVPDQPAAAAPP